MWGPAALELPWCGSSCRRGVLTWLLRTGLPSLVPARRAWASSDPFQDNGSLGSKGDLGRGREGREGGQGCAQGAKMVLRLLVLGRGT